METVRFDVEEEPSGSESQPSVSVPLISVYQLSSTYPSKENLEKTVLLGTSITKTEGSSSPRAPRSCQLSRANSNWFLWEITAALSSIVLIVALIVVPYIYNDRAAPSWPYGVTVSTLIKSDCFRH